MKTWLHKYFDLSKREFNGLMGLSVLLLGVMVFPYIYTRLFPYHNDTAADKIAIQQLSLVDKYPADNYANEPGKKGEIKVKPVLFMFDPNTIDLTGWQKLGLSSKQAQSILKYRSKGGKFYKKEDLQKMYTISPKVYTQIAPFVHIEPVAGDTYIYNKDVYKKKEYSLLHNPHILPVIEINGADSLQLDQVRGIGPAFARRIVKYRERLGGFSRKEQLLEVFGLDSLKFKEIKDQLSVDETLVKKIPINTAEFEDFKYHPYLKYKQVNALIQYRKQHGNYSSIADLKKVVILTPDIIAQLAPYLSF